MNGNEGSFAIGESTRILVVTDPINGLNSGLFNLQAKTALDAVVETVAQSDFPSARGPKWVGGRDTRFLARLFPQRSEFVTPDGGFVSFAWHYTEKGYHLIFIQPLIWEVVPASVLQQF